jgi:hypothetical protein
LVDVPATDSKIAGDDGTGMGELIPSNGWPDRYQERKLSNHVATAQLLEGVAVSYFRVQREHGRSNHNLGIERLWLYKSQRLDEELRGQRTQLAFREHRRRS